MLSLQEEARLSGLLNSSVSAYAAFLWLSTLLLALELPIAMRRGRISSGISRTNSMCNNPLSSSAPVTLM